MQELIDALKGRGYKVTVYHNRLTTGDARDLFQSSVSEQLRLIQAWGVPAHVLRGAQNREPLRVSPRGGYTEVTVRTAEGEEVAKGVAVCSMQDNFVKRVGFVKAVGRLTGELKRAGVLD